MPFNIINNQFGLFNFIRRYGVAVQELIEEINGFLTTTAGVYNPVNYPDRWKNVQSKLKEIPFGFHYLEELPVITKKNTSKKFKLNIFHAQIPLYFKDNLQIMLKNSGTEISPLTIKTELYRKKTQKLKIFKKFLVNIENPLTVNMWLKSSYTSPLSVLIWLKRKLTTNLRVKSWLVSRESDRLEDKTYLFDDVGTISDIEMLDIIKEIDVIDAIR